ncbi:MAG: DUF599 family protein [Promethearchaeati archaeon]
MIDEIAFIFFFSCILLYSILLIIRFRRDTPFKLTIYNKIYEDWVKNRLDGSSEISTVQILRNMQVGNSTLISALFILLGILLGFYNTSFLDTSAFFWIEELELGLVKITINISVIMFCVINFILSIRAITRCSILISGKPQNYKVGKMDGLTAAKNAFISGKNHWMYGIRGLFFLTASLIWFLNAIIFMILTALISVYLITFRDIKRIKE